MSNEFLTSTPRATYNALQRIVSAGCVPYVESSPGLGKSALAKKLAKEYNLKLIDHRLSTSTPEDLSGLPRFNEKGEAVFAPFAELFPLSYTPIPDGYDGWLILLDEFPSASREVQAAAYKLVLDRMVGQHDLHDRCVIMCAGNRRSDRAIVNPIGTAMASRLIHISMVASFKEWLEDVAMVQKYDARIVAFLSQYPARLDNFNPESVEKTFACPRTWEFANRLIQGHLVTDEDTVLLAGAIGQGVAIEFVQFCKVFGEIPTKDEILANPLTVAVPTTAQRCWAVTSMLMEHVDDKTAGPLTQYIDRLSADFRLLFYKGVNIRNPKMIQNPVFKKALFELSQYMYA